MIKIISFPDPIIQFDFENVYTPSDDTYLLIDYFKESVNEKYFDGLNIENIEKILDLGTGTGIIAIFFQLIKGQITNFNPQIYASDILEEALKCAKLNEKLNGIKKKITFIKSDLFKSFPSILKNAFEIIIFNPPYLPSIKTLNEKEKQLNIDYSWNGGKKGFEVFADFIEQAKKYLNLQHKCYIYTISSSRTNLNDLNNIITQNGFENKILNKKHIFFEDIILNRLTIGKI
ncbi:MAG: HemK2/MTQ2 family protein methyltransferase [Candidatus Hodarchaeota archaeon]